MIPRVGRDYPGAPRTFYSWFSKENAALEWIANLRWESGFTCPRCSSAVAWTTGPGERRCMECRHRVTALAGTPFNRLRLETRKILEAAWLMTYPTSGTNASALSRDLEINRESAWTILHKYRQVMHTAMLSVKLKGIVEVDESYIGGVQSGVVGRGALGKYCVLIMVERRKGGQMRMVPVESAARQYLFPEIEAAIPIPATIHTDANASYNTLPSLGYRHKEINVSTSKAPAHVYLPVIHSAASNLNTWLEGGIRRMPDERHFPYYLAEYAYRFNHRQVKNRGLIFYRLMQDTLKHAPITQTDIIQR
jgi:transposase-like protein